MLHEGSQSVGTPVEHLLAPVLCVHALQKRVYGASWQTYLMFLPRCWNWQTGTL